jgi:hypothetical protein
MTKEQYFQLKEEQKELGKKIRETKGGFREDQRNFSKCQSTANDYYKGKTDSATWEKIRPEYNKLNEKQFKSMCDLHKTQREYRHKHIIYCFARGKTMKQIEPKVREHNEPNQTELQRLMKLYDVREPLALEVAI